jgi:spore coat protein CotH
MTSAFLFAFLAACTVSDDSGGSEGGNGPGATELPADTGAADTAEEAGPDDEWGCADIYAVDKLPAYELDIATGDWARLRADFSAGRKDYHEAVLHLDGETADVQVRLKGNPDFSWFGDKMQFVLSFNEVDPDARFHGLRKTTLDSTWYDSTLLRDRLSWDVMRRAGGLPAACANNATLTINGEFYGIYGHIEYFDHEYLERAFGKEAADGGLWKYGAEPTANADIADEAAIRAFWKADTLDEMESVGDVSQWARAWAAETVLGDADGYVCCAHNFYLYDHPEEGVLFVPWDFDDTLEVTAFDDDPIEGYDGWAFSQPHFLTVLESPAYRAAYVEHVAELNEAMDPELMRANLAAWDAQIAEAVAADPLHTWGVEERTTTIERLDAWFLARHQFLDTWVACERGSPVDADGDGLDSCSDRDDSTPVGEETCNGRDDDNDGAIDELESCDDCIRHDLDEDHLLMCRWPRTAAEAQTHCEERGGNLASIGSTEALYMTYFWTWPDDEPWWLSGVNGGNCYSWDESTFTFAWTPCSESHPSVCALP